MTTIAVTEAAQRRLFFAKQMEEAKNNLAKAEIGLRSSGIGEATALVEVFLNSAFSGEPRHSRRLAMVTEFEETGTPPALPEPEVP